MGGHKWDSYRTTRLLNQDNVDWSPLAAYQAILNSASDGMTFFPVFNFKPINGGDILEMMDLE